MSESKKLTKEQLIKAIEKLEKNPNDRVGLLGDIGVTAIGAIGAGAAATVLGTTTASIPLITALTGGTVVAVAGAPFALMAGAAVAGGAAVYGVSRLIKGGGFNEGKKKQLLADYKDKLKDIEAKERQSSFNEQDKTTFYSFLKDPLKYNLISPDEARQLMQAVESGHMSLSEAYKLVGQVLEDDKVTPSKESEKVVTSCPECSQKLRAPTHLGRLDLTCPKCKHSWAWVPK
jgi:hypothetical protein